MKLVENLKTNHAQQLNFTPTNAIIDASRRAKRDFFISCAKEGNRNFWKHVK